MVWGVVTVCFSGDTEQVRSHDIQKQICVEGPCINMCMATMLIRGVICAKREVIKCVRS